MLQGQHDGRAACCRWPAPPQEYGNTADGERDIDDPATSFGELLSCLRLAIGVSQNALGREAGVNASYINRLERGERATPTREVVLALARSLHATPPERDHLLFVAGYVPLALLQLGPRDRTLMAVAGLLSDQRFPPECQVAFRTCVETMAAHWRRSTGDPGARGPSPSIEIAARRQCLAACASDSGEDDPAGDTQ